MSGLFSLAVTVVVIVAAGWVLAYVVMRLDRRGRD